VRPEHDERFRRIADDYLDRPGGDYAELLQRGEVSSPEDVDPEAWRAEIRAKARADKIRVMTFRAGDRAIAARRMSIPKDQELALLTAALERSEVLRGAAEPARRLGHEIVRWVAHDQESIAMCPRCHARIYARLDIDPPVVVGVH
jgi:phage FluMu gp28-like protein